MEKEYEKFIVHQMEDNYSMIHIEIKDNEEFYKSLFDCFFTEDKLIKYAENKFNLKFSPTKINFTTLYKHLKVYIDDFNKEQYSIDELEEEMLKVLNEEYSIENKNGNLRVRLDKIGKIGEYIFSCILNEYFKFQCIIPKVHLQTSYNMSIYGIDTLFYSEENMYYMQEHHEPIISERMFNQAQEILQKRGGVRGSGRRKGNFSRKYPFSSRLYCGFCGSFLTRRNWHSGTKNSITVWHCMEFVKHGKENCPHCKAIKETIIEEAFTQSYKLLCDSNKELIQTFLNEMEEIIQEESNESSIKRLEEEKQILKEKIDKLIDLNLNGTISTEILQEKKAKLQNKINKLTKEQEHLQLEIEDSMSLNQGLNKFKTLFKDNEIMPNFDKEVFELMIEKVIIGEKGSKGKANPRVITFILKSGNEIKCEEDNKNSVVKENLITEENQNQQSSYEARENYLQKVSEPCGVLLGAISKRFDTIVEFTAFEDFISFEKKGKNKIKRVENHKIKVTIEVDLVCGVV